MVTGTASVTHKIADHHGIVLRMPLELPIVKRIPRMVWHLREAKWQHLIYELKSVDWSILEQGNVDDSATLLQSILLGFCRKYIPWRQIEDKKSSHPWLTPECHCAIQAKNDAEGSEEYASTCEKCASVFKEAYRKYNQDLRDKIASLPRCSKKWWRLNRELLNR